MESRTEHEHVTFIFPPELNRKQSVHVIDIEYVGAGWGIKFMTREAEVDMRLADIAFVNSSGKYLKHRWRVV